MTRLELVAKLALLFGCAACATPEIEPRAESPDVSEPVAFLWGAGVDTDVGVVGRMQFSKSNFTFAEAAPTRRGSEASARPESRRDR